MRQPTGKRKRRLIITAFLVGALVVLGIVAGRDWAIFLAIPVVLFAVIGLTRPDRDTPHRPTPGDYQPPGAAPS